MMRFILSSMLLGLTACSDYPSSPDFYGVYITEDKGFKQKIVLKSDGTYSNILYKNGVLVWQEDNAWEAEKVENQNGVTFSNFRWGLPSYSFTQHGYWFVSPEQTFLNNVVKLCYDLDLDKCFERDPNSQRE